MNNEIFLSGGGGEKQSFPLDKIFFDKLPKNGKLLYIPIALRGHRLYPTAANWLWGVAGLHDRSDLIIDVWDSVAGKKAEDLLPYDAIYIGGGNTWSLMKEVVEGGFDKLLTEYSETRGLLYGGSAGAIILGKRIDTHDDKNEVGWTDVSGLNCIGGYSIACHFKEAETDTFVEWAKANRSHIVCLPEETGLIIKGGRGECIGTKECLVLTPKGETIKIANAQTFPLK